MDVYDRFEREDRGGAFLMGLLAGTVLGAGLGMLFAPKAGSELRNQLAESGRNLGQTASDGYRRAAERVSTVVDRGREVYDRARGTVNEAAERGREAYERARSTVAEQVAEVSDRGRDVYEQMRGVVTGSTDERRGQS